MAEKRQNKQEGGLLSDDREKYVFGASAIAKMITNLVKKSPKKDKDFYKKFGEKDLMEYIVMPENLEKFPTKDLRGVIKENNEIIRNIKTDPDERRLDELEFYLDFNDEIEVEIYQRKNPKVSKKDALEKILIRRAEEEAVDKAMDNLRYDPIVIHDSDVEVLGVYEVDYESGEKKWLKL